MKNISVVIFAGLVILIGGFFYLKSINKLQETPTQKPEGTSSSQIIPGYQGKVLAGKSAPFLEFKKEDYQKALSENKIIILDFYANWCPICRAEAPIIHSGFDGLTTEKVIGFRVNYNDSDTDADEKALAKQFNITYQHTKVILKNGQQFSKSLDSWTREDFVNAINQAL